jgi:hypothetical protein
MRRHLKSRLSGWTLRGTRRKGQASGIVMSARDAQLIHQLLVRISRISQAISQEIEGQYRIDEEESYHR